MNTINTKFAVIDTDGIVFEKHDSIRDAVISAARYDSWAALFARDEDGKMRLFSSRKHWGNNFFAHDINDAYVFDFESSNTNDEQAEIEVAELVYKKGVFHYEYDVKVVQLVYEDGKIITVDGETVETLADNADINIEEYRAIYA